MSFNNHLSKMDKDALLHVIKDAQALLDEKNKEATKLIWIVSDNWCNIGWFKEHEYVKAAEFLANEAKEAIQDTSNPIAMRLMLDYIRVPESEYSGWFSD